MLDVLDVIASSVTISVMAVCLVATIGMLLYVIKDMHDKNIRANAISQKDAIAQQDRVRAEVYSVLRQRPVVRVITNKEDGMFLPMERKDTTAEQQVKDARVREMVERDTHSGVLS